MEAVEEQEKKEMDSERKVSLFFSILLFLINLAVYSQSYYL